MLLGCTLLSEKDIGTAKEAGYDYVEFMGRYLCSLEADQFNWLQKETEKKGIRVLGINAYCSEEIVIAGTYFDAGCVRRYAKKCAERTAQLGVQYVGIGSPNSRNLPNNFPKSLALQQLKEFLLITVEEFAKYDCTVCLEMLAPCYCNFVNHLEEAAAIVKELNHHMIRLVADFYNMEQVSEADWNLKPWIGLIAHVHLSDDDGSPSRRSFLKPERAEIHSDRIRNLYQAGYQGAITLEVDLPMDKKRAEESLRIMRKII